MSRAIRGVCFAALLLLAMPIPLRAATVSGFVYGEENGEALSYSDVFLAGTSRGRVANLKGYYVITGIPAGDHNIVFTHVGYKTEIRAITLTEDEELSLTVELIPVATEVEAIEIDAERSEIGIRRGQLSLNTDELNRIPTFLEADLIRSVQMLPGVSSLSDFSSGLYVRGGSADQNLILLDDADVYNPNHLFGFFSTFNVDAVKTVNLRKSGYPARYGGRLSSLLDVHNRDGNRKEFAGTARVGLIASSATIEGPWKRGSWMLSGRHTYIEQLARMRGIDLPYKFYDFHGKLNWDLGRDDRSSFSYYEGLDRLDWDRDGFDLLLDWGNRTMSAQWTRLFSPRLFTNFTMTYSRFDSRAVITFQDLEFEMRNDIDDVGLKGVASYSPNASHQFDFGAEAKALDFHFERGYEEGDDVDFNYDGEYAALYAQETWKLSEQLHVEGGLRLDYYSDGDYYNLGPRLTIRQRLARKLSASATYGKYHQYLNLVSIEGNFADMWFPVDHTLAPGEADHYIFGIEAGPYESFDLTVEGYFKPYRNVVEFSEEFTRSLVSPDARMDELFNSGDGEAYGFDAYLRNNYAGFSGWVGYTLGWTKRTIEGFNFDEEYYPQYDRRHQFVMMQERSLGKGWKLNLAFKYGTGQPTTLATGRYTVHDITGREYDVVLDGEMNAYRLPAYHRLDVGFAYRAVFDDVIFEPNIQIINLYNSKNVFIRAYDTSKNPVEFEDITMLPFLPTIGIRATF